jgi:guanine nucleotide-binding protein G(i) subunit alpha
MERISSKEEVKRNQDINEYLRKERKRLETVIRLLLLGTGESGKSTFAKQIKVIYMNGYSKEEERVSFKNIIFKNLTENMKSLIQAANNFGFKIKDQAAAELIKAHKEPDQPTEKEAQAILALWKDESIQKAYQCRSEFQLDDSAEYFISNAARLAESKYIPSVEDVLRSRQMTTGVTETEFPLEKATFVLVDVGGQRSERRKWIHVFQDVTAVIFIASLSEYDQKLAEDEHTNRMQESLKVFKEICNLKVFANTHMILFLNKSDIFRDKLKKVQLNKFFPEYTGGANYEKATEFIKNLFISQNENTGKHIYTHVTCATDKDNINVVFNAVKDIILHKVLDESGLGIN